MVGMGLYLNFSLLFLSIIIFLFLHKKRKASTNPTTSKLPHPPGSTGWPLVGETLTYLSLAKKGFPYKFIADRVARYSSPKIFKTSLLGETMAVMCTPEGNKFLFSNENKLVRTWWPASFQKIFFPSSDSFTEHTKTLRRLVVPSFLRPQSLQNYVHFVDSLTKQHMHEYWQGKQVVNVQELSRDHAFNMAIRLLLSIDDTSLIDKLKNKFTDMGKGMIALPFNFPGTRYRRGLMSSRELGQEILHLLKKRRENPNVGNQEDFLSFLLHHTDENGELLSERDVMIKVIAFVFPSYETSAISITCIVNYLAELPHVYDQVRKEQMEIAKSRRADEVLNWEDMQKMTYSWNVAREVLRLKPALFGAYKEAIVDFNYEGFFIPKGWKLHWNAYATHMNPNYFPEPESFDPSRFEGSGPIPYSYVSFGGGPRMCPGVEFARMQILIFMHHLVTKYKFEKVFPDEKLVSDPTPIATKGLPIRLYPH